MVTKKKTTTDTDAIECPYCAHPNLFEPPEDEPIERTSSLVSTKGKYWRKLVTRERDGSSKTWRVKSLPTLIYENKTAGRLYKKQWRFQIIGKKEFIKRFQDFTVNVIGLEFKGIPIMSSGPGFYRVGPSYHVVDTVTVLNETCLLFSACRINHAKSDIIIDAHSWPSHKLLFTIYNYPLAPTKDSRLIIDEALEFFTVETRGNPKISEEAIAAALKKLGSRATQREVADELKVTESGLERWHIRRKMTWEKVKEYYFV
jgi:hypothetical protein